MPEQLTIRVIDGGGSVGEPTPPTAPAAPTTAPTRPPTAPPSEPQPSAPAVEPGARTAIGAAESVGSALAAGNVSGAVSQVASRALAAITGPVGIAATAVVASFGVAAVAAKTFANVVERQVTELAGFSGAVSVALAETELARTQAQLRRAARIGGDLADVERIRSRFEIAMSDLGTEILGTLLRIAKLVEPIITKITESVEFLNDSGLAQSAALIAALGPLGAILDLVLRWFEREEGEDRDDDDVVDPIVRGLLQGNAGEPNMFPRGNFGVPAPGPGF